MASERTERRKRAGAAAHQKEQDRKRRERHHRRMGRLYKLAVRHGALECQHCEFRSGRMCDYVADHVRPTSKGGPDHMGNRQILCISCNLLKAEGNMHALKRKRKQIDEVAGAWELRLASEGIPMK